MTGTDGDPDLQVGFELTQPHDVRVRLEPRAEQQDGEPASHEGLATVPLADTADDRRRHRLRDGPHEVDDPAGELLVARAHVVDVRAADRLAVRPLELLCEATEEPDGLGQRIDRPGVDEDEGARGRWRPATELDRGHPAKA